MNKQETYFWKELFLRVIKNLFLPDIVLSALDILFYLIITLTS